MALQERGKPKFVLPPSAERARVNDLTNKKRCWEGHIRIARAREDSEQIRLGNTRLKELEWQIGEASRGFK